MNELVTILSALVEHGPALLSGVSAVLLAGVLAMLLHRAPLQRRWLGLVTALGAGLYLVVGLWPLPRLALRTADSEQQTLGADAIAGLTAEQRLSRLQAALASLDEGSQPASSQLAATNSVSLGTEAGAIAAPAAASRWSWPLLLAAVYAFGAAIMLVRLLAGRLRLARLLTGCKPVPSVHWRGIQWPRGTRVLSSPRAVRPFCCGVLRPVVVVPRTLLAESDAVALQAVLRHEAAHLVAGDVRALALLSWLSVPLFCHPLFWWLCREVRFCSELLADEAAAAADGRQQYARALIELAERDDPTVAAVGTIAVFRRPSEFYRRIQMLLQRQGSLSMSASRLRRAALSATMLCLVGAAASVFGVPAAAQDPVPPVQQQNAELRQAIETIALLRAELAALRSKGEVPQFHSHDFGVDALQQFGADAAAPPAARPDQQLPGQQAPRGQEPVPATPGSGAPAQAKSPLLHDAFGAQGEAAGALPPRAATSMGDSATSASALADLASRYLDLQAELEVQRDSTARLKTLAEAGQVQVTESKAAATRLRALERKVAIVARLVDGEIAATDAELRWLITRRAAASPAEVMPIEQQMDRARTRLEVLSSLR
jgi:beta-lactamase regulating signal transducer with metallopeptidase domain